MPDAVPPLWFDVVSDLTAHIAMARDEAPAQGAAIAAILEQASQAILHLQSPEELARAERWGPDSAVSKAMRRELERAMLVPNRISPR